MHVRVLVCLLILFAGGGSAHAAEETASATPAVAAPPSLDDFLADPLFGEASLSPDGKHLAIATNGDVPAVQVTDLATNKTVPVLMLTAHGVPLKGATVQWIRWKSNDRVLIGLSLIQVKRVGDKQSGDVVSIRYGDFMMAVDRDGKNSVQLLKGDFWNASRGADVSLLDRLLDDPGHILAVASDGVGYPQVWKVDVGTGAAEKIESADDRNTRWKTDRNGVIVGRIRVVYDTVVIEGRAPGENHWSTIARIRPKDEKTLSDFQFLGPTDKPAQLYVAVNAKDSSEGDYRTLRVYDFAAKTLSAPVWTHLDHDVDDIVYDSGTYDLAGVCYTADVETCDYKDPAVAANMRGINTFFGGKRNITPISTTKDGRWWLFAVSGPDEPDSYYLYDWNDKSIALLAERHKHLPTDVLAEMTTWSYPTRDGVTIHGYLSRPRAAPTAPLPLIVLPHGGPEARDSYAYDQLTQYLATRGYLVFQPNFRGSQGYGLSFVEAGQRHWGDRMANDITDGVRRLIDTGQADPARICIVGISYGGYAALYAGATHPELYKCVASWAGITDLPAFLAFEHREGGSVDSERYRYWKKQIGDPNADAEAIRKASPVTYAATYGPPVLLLHGDDDDIVPLEQSRIMERALKRANKLVKLVVYKNEDHPDWEPESQKAAMIELLNFVETYVHPWTAPTSPSQDATLTTTNAR